MDRFPTRISGLLVLLTLLAGMVTLTPAHALAEFTVTPRVHEQFDVFPESRVIFTGAIYSLQASTTVSTGGEPIVFSQFEVDLPPEVANVSVAPTVSNGATVTQIGNTWRVTYNQDQRLGMQFQLKHTSQIVAPPPTLTFSVRAFFNDQSGASHQGSGSVTVDLVAPKLTITGIPNGVSPGESFPVNLLLDGDDSQVSGYELVVEGPAAARFKAGSATPATFSFNSRRCWWLSLSSPIPGNFHVDAEVLPVDQLPPGTTQLAYRATSRVYVRRMEGPNNQFERIYSAPLETWTRNVPIGESGAEVTVDATTPTPGRVRPDETAIVNLTARAAGTAKSLTVTCTVPTQTVTVDKKSISKPGKLKGSTITWVFKNTETASPPPSFHARVKPVEQIPDTVRFVPFQANAVATYADKPADNASDLEQLDLLRGGAALLVRSDTREPTFAYPGEVINYAVQAQVTDTAATWVIEATIPAGTVLVADSITGGGSVSSGKVRWEFTNTGTVPILEFKARVGVGDDLEGIENLVCEATSTALIQGEEEVAEASAVDALKGFPVTGKVRDVAMDYPVSANVHSDRIIPDAVVRLLAMTPSGEKQIAIVNTNSAGEYEAQSRYVGEIAIQSQVNADGFDKVALQVVPNLLTVKQRVTAIVDPELPKTERDLILPRGVVNNSSRALLALNNIPIPLFSGALTFDTIRLYYETDGIQAFIEDLLEDAPEFKAVFNGVNEKDRWNGLIVLSAFMHTLALRTRDAVTLADDAGKVAALLLCVEMVKRLGKKGILPAAKLPKQLLAQRARVAIMAFGVGVLAPRLLDALGFKGQQKAQAMQVLASAIRWAMVKATGLLADDRLFELVFHVLRMNITSALMTGWFGTSSSATVGFPQIPIPGVVPGADLLTQALALSQNGGYTSSIVPALGGGLAMENAGKKQYVKDHTAASRAVTVLSVFRGVSGIYAKTADLEIAHLSGPEKKQFFDSIASDPDRRSRARVFSESLNSAAVLVTSTTATVATCAALGGMHLQSQIAEDAAELIYGVNFGPAEAPGAGSRGGQGVATAALAELAAPPLSAAEENAALAGTLFPQGAQPALAEYQAALKDLGTAVAGNNVAAVEALGPRLLAADQAFFADFLDPAAGRIDAALAREIALNSRQVKQLQQAREAFLTAAQTTAGALAQVAAWTDDPTLFPSDTALKSIPLASRNLEAAAAWVTKAERALTGVTVPGGLSIVEITPDNGEFAKSQSYTLTFRVTNYGGAATAPGVVRFVPADGRIVVQGELQFNLPSLAPGQSAEYAWTITAAEALQRGVVTYQVQAATSDNSILVSYQDEVLIYPG